MVNIPLVPTTYRRDVAKEPSVTTVNRFAEKNPVLNESPVSVIARPGMRKFTEVGSGPIRKLFSQPGCFNENLFAVSGVELYRVDEVGTGTLLGSLGTSAIGSVSMCATAPIGDTVPAYLWIADGGILWVYTSNGFALGNLQVTSTINNNDTVQIDGVYYKWTNASVDAGTPAGTLANPWLVRYVGANATDLLSLYYAINKDGVGGTDYSTALVEHPTVRATNVSAEDLFVLAKTVGTVGNSYSTTETGTGINWLSATMTGGGADQLRQVMVPGDVGAISVAVINSYVIVVPVQSEDIKGRFYFIQPGEVVIDPLDFATAERSPDGIGQVITYGDMFWLFGQTTTEPWIVTGNQPNPVQRFQGILFDRGSWEGTAIKVKDAMFVIDEEGGLFRIANGQTRVTQNRPDIEERIRKAIQYSSFFGV
jgi:hypothetical protein